MEHTKEKTRELCAMRCQLVEALKAQMGNLDALCTEEAGEVVDMIKDLAEAEAYCWKSLYYKTVVEAMEEKEVKARCNETMSDYIHDMEESHPHETWTRPAN